MAADVLLSINTGYWGESLEVDNEGNIIVGYSSSGISLQKYSPAFVLLWSKEITGIMYAVHVDAYNNIYVCTASTVTKLDPNGNVLWSNSSVGSISSMAVDSSGNVYSGHSTGDYNGAIGAILRKLSPTGAFLWQLNWPGHYTGVRDVATDSVGNCYCSYDDGTDDWLTKFNSSAGVVWTKSMTGGVLSDVIKVDGSDNVYGGAYPCVVTKWTSAGALVWISDQSALVEDMYGNMDVSADGNVYTAGYWIDPMLKLSNAGPLEWSYTPLINECQAVHAGNNDFCYALYQYTLLKIGNSPPIPRTHFDGFLLGYQAGVSETAASEALTTAHIGPKGPEGIIGPTGPDGAKGLTGLSGATGLQGLKGATGTPGLAGANGTDGAQGAQGAQGIQGISGAIGPKGITGVNGLNGIVGPAVPVFTDIQLYNDGVIATRSDLTSIRYPWLKDFQGRLIQITNTVIEYFSTPTP